MCSLRHSSGSRRLKLPTKPFCIGFPGAMQCQTIAVVCCQVRMAFKVSSVP